MAKNLKLNIKNAQLAEALKLGQIKKPSVLKKKKPEELESAASEKKEAAGPVETAPTEPRATPPLKLKKRSRMSSRKRLRLLHLLAKRNLSLPIMVQRLPKQEKPPSNENLEERPLDRPRENIQREDTRTPTYPSNQPRSPYPHQGSRPHHQTGSHYSNEQRREGYSPGPRREGYAPPGGAQHEGYVQGPDAKVAILQADLVVKEAILHVKGGYPPSGPRREGGYPPREGGYPPGGPRREGGYPPREGGYPPSGPRREGGYPPSGPRREGGYPPREGGYPPSGPRREGGYPPSGPRREGGYPPSGPRREGGYPPSGPRREGGYPPSGPRREGYTPMPVLHCREKDSQGEPRKTPPTREPSTDTRKAPFKDFREYKPSKKGTQPEKTFDSRDRQGLRHDPDEQGWRKKRPSHKMRPIEQEEIIRPKELKVRLPISIKDLASEMKLKASQLIAKMFMKGIVVTLNDLLDDETTIQLLGHDFDCEISIDTAEADRVRITDKTIKQEILEIPIRFAYSSPPCRCIYGSR